MTPSGRSFPAGSLALLGPVLSTVMARSLMVLMAVLWLGMGTPGDGFAQTTGSPEQTQASAGDALAESLARFTARAIYNLDNDQLRAVVDPFLEQNQNIRGLRVIESIDDELMLSYYRDLDSGAVVFDDVLPSNVMELDRFSAKSVFEGEVIGTIQIWVEVANELGLTPAELAWIRDNPVIRVHNETNWPPFNFAIGGNPRGLSIDVMNLLAEKTGLQVEYVTGPSWSDFLQMMRAGELDVMLNIVKTEERQTYLLYTPPYMSNPNAILSRRDQRFTDVESLNGKTVAVPKGFFFEEVLARDYPDIKLLTVVDILAGMKAVAFGDADAAFGELAVLQYLLAENMLGDLVISGEVELGNPEYSLLNIATRIDSPELASILTKAVRSLTPETMGPLRDRWLTFGSEIDAQDPDAGKSPAVLVQEQLAQETQASAYQDLLIIVMVLGGILVALLVLGRFVAKGNPTRLYRSRPLLIMGVGVVLLVLGGVVVGTKLALDVLERQTRDRIAGSLITTVDGRRAHVESWIGHHLLVGKQLAEDRELRRIAMEVAESPDPADNLYRLTSYFTDLGVDHFVFLDAQGQTLVGDIVDSHAVPLDWPKVAPRVLQTLETDLALFLGTIKVSTIQRPLTRPMPFFSVPLPGVSSANAEQGGVPRVLIISAAEGERLSRIMAFGQLFSTGETYAFSEDGLMLSASRFGDQLVEMGLIRSPGDEVLNLRVADPEVDLTTGAQSPLAPEDRTLTKMVQSALRDGSGFDVDGTGYRDYRGVPVFGAWQWIASSQIGITTEVDVAEALGPYQETRLILLSLVGGVVAIGLGLTGVSIWTGRSASRNLWVANQELEQRVEERAQDAVTSERRMRAIIDNAVDGIITIDDQGTVEDFSAAAGQIFGYTPQEVIGQNIKMLMAPEIAREHDGYLSAYRAGGRPHVVGKNREVTGRKKDGTTFPMDLAVGEILIEGRKTFTGIVRDISARKKAGEALTLSEERTRLILESVGEGVFGVDLDGRITFVNQSAEKLLGFLAREMIGQKAHPLFHHHRRDGSVYPVHDCWMFKSFTEGESYRIDNEVLWRKDRKPLEVEYFATPIRKDGAIVGAVVSFSDISKRRDAERKLKQAFRLSQKTLREMDAVLEAIDYGICFMDKDLRVRVMNQAFMTQWHFDPDVLAAKPTMEELIRRNRYNGLYYLADPSDDDAFDVYVQERVEAVREGGFPAVEMTRADGKVLIYQCFSLPDGERMLTYFDISEQKQAEGKLKDAYEVISGSIDYAARIQRSVLPDPAMLRAFFTDHFVIWEPRDTVGGDIYWAKMWKDSILLILGDCTGHGVPGAFMTLISSGALERAMLECVSGDLSQLISELHRSIQITLGQHGVSGESDDGLELGACLISPDMTEMTYVGARFSLFIVEDGAVSEVKGTRKGLGYRRTPASQTFDAHRIEVRDGMRFFMTSDGMIDQIGEKTRRSYGKKRFIQLLQEVGADEMSDQKAAMQHSLQMFQGLEPRRDDVSVIGFRL